MLNVIMLSDAFYTNTLNTIMLSVIVLNVFMLSVIILSVIMLSVVSPKSFIRFSSIYFQTKVGWLVTIKINLEKISGPGAVFTTLCFLRNLWIRSIS
jgi:hypothetical protein